MPKFMIRGSYSADGLKGLVREGGGARRDAIKATVESAGGTLETFHYGFGEGDLYAIVDVPDQEAMTAIALTIGASGALSPHTTALLTPEQVDAAAKREVKYRPPGA